VAGRWSPAHTRAVRVVSLIAPGELVVEERPSRVLADGEVRVAMRAAGVCSSDLPRAHGGAYFTPLVLGHELAGVVAEGAGLAPGTPVTIFPLLPCFACGPCHEEEYARCGDYSYLGSREDGGFATEVVAPAWNLLPVPPGVSLTDAALTEPLAVVVHALDRLGLPAARPATLAIVGDGFLALLAVAVLARTRPDVEVTVVGRRPSKLARAAALGARTTTEADGAWDFVLEAVGAPPTLTAALALAAPGGTVVWMGNPSADVTLPRDLTWRVLRKELTLRGSWNSRYRGRAPSDWTVALQLMADGLRPTDFVTTTSDLAGLPGLLADLQARKLDPDVPSELKALVRIDADRDAPGSPAGAAP